jgi:hypothetical protein
MTCSDWLPDNPGLQRSLAFTIHKRPSVVGPLVLQALQYDSSSHIVAGGALATISGAKTGRRCGIPGRSVPLALMHTVGHRKLLVQLQPSGQAHSKG